VKSRAYTSAGIGNGAFRERRHDAQCAVAVPFLERRQKIPHLPANAGNLIGHEIAVSGDRDHQRQRKVATRVVAARGCASFRHHHVREATD
jgi:hypothetical protein